MTDTTPPLAISRIETGPIGTNCWIVERPASNDAVIIDPGADADVLAGHLRGLEATVHAILVTHVHWDHIGAVAPLARELGLPVYISRIEAGVLASPDGTYPPELGTIEGWQAEHELDGGEQLRFGELSCDVMHLPGHSPGTMGFCFREAGMPPVAATGDVLFAGSVGRVDLPMAEPADLVASLRRMLAELDPETVVLPGHGPATTLSREQETNPFLRQPELLTGGA